MDEFSISSDNREQTDKDILTNTVSDEAIEAVNREETDKDILTNTVLDEAIEAGIENDRPIAVGRRRLERGAVLLEHRS